MQVTRVQDVCSTFKDAIPDAFIRPENEQPATTTVPGQRLDIPVIDLSDPDEGRIRSSIVKASEQHGMFQVVNHGIPEELISKLQSVGKEFFGLPQEEKEAYGKLPGSLEGYGSTLLQKEKEEEGKKLGWVDHLFHKIWPPSAINYRFWPKNPPSYKEVNEEYAKYLHGVVNRLFTNLSLGLGLEENELRESVGGEQLEFLLKINYYPPCPRPDLALGVPAHTDMSSITILVPNEVQGLQASRDGKWYEVLHAPNALFIHIGDQLEIVSNGQYKSVLHRSTVNKDATRMSWPVFLEPPQEFVVGPHPKLVKDGEASMYKTKKFGDYAYCKLNKLPQ